MLIYYTTLCRIRISLFALMNMQYLRSCVPFRISLAHSFCAVMFVPFVIQEWMSSPASQPYLPTNQLKGSACSTTLRNWLAMKGLKLLGLCGTAHLRPYISATAASWKWPNHLFPLQAYHDCPTWPILCLFNSLLLGSSLCTTWGVYITSVIKLMSMSCIYFVCYTCSLADKWLYGHTPNVSYSL